VIISNLDPHTAAMVADLLLDHEVGEQVDSYQDAADRADLTRVEPEPLPPDAWEDFTGWLAAQTP
jgi:hypothetical protein